MKNLDANRIDQATVKITNKIVYALGKKTITDFFKNEQSFRWRAL